ncbi:N-acetylneuraminate synthase family protein [Gammaproteobacteria bacterium]|nr:N-acetylneuraminate synthase family protein [Gammaproteobacteria bacterium]
MKKSNFKKEGKCFIIAEIGVNHNGDIQLAHKMIDSAKKCGADAVKFQTFTAEKLVSPTTPKVSYQKITTTPNESHFDMIKKLELSFDHHHILKKYCNSQNIEFLSTPYDIESAKFLHEKLDVNFFKTASADIVDIPLQSYISGTGKHSFVSVGMATMSEVHEVVKIYKKNNLTLMHCVSNYPCKDQSLNMNVLSTLKNTFDISIGYSDHSIGNDAALLSIALGSCVVEKHFTLDKDLSGPDHRASSDPIEFSDLVNIIRKGEKILGNSTKKIQPEEEEMRLVSRKSLTLSNSLKAGDKIRESDLILKRPGTGLMYSEFNNLLGRVVNRNLSKDYQIQFDDLK